jgi:transposase
MISFNRRTKVFVCKEPTDMRASYDTLFAKAKGVLQQDPFSGHLFLFINSKRTSIKCLFYDGTGLVIIAKRMERGLFSRINPMYRGEITMTAAEFALYFEGSDLEKRFITPSAGPAAMVDSPSEIKKSAFPMNSEIKKSFPANQQLKT